jgi:adenosylhomocysteine nucleosidase
MRRVAILAATGRELTPVRTALQECRRGPLGQFRHEIGRAGTLEVHLIRMGIGPDRARAASEQVFGAVSPEAAISTGYAGALGPAEVGEVILGIEVHDWTRDRSQPVTPADAGLLQVARMAARESGLVWTQGPVVTVGTVIWRAAEKHALSEASGAVAMDMESAVIAQAAAEAAVPCLVARTVFDRVGDDLPMDFNLWFAPWGAARVFMEILRRPSILSSLYRLERHEEQASETLARFFRALFLAFQGHPSPTDLEYPVAAGAR